jgi:Tol biopolymer transport system component
MIARDRVKLLDFGLAKLRDPEQSVGTGAVTRTLLTDDRTIVGTVPYMGPEQIEGREVDGRTDIFSFGVVLYEMVAGRRPFTGDSRAALMAAIVAGEPPVLSGVQPLTPPSLARLVGRCLAKDPEDRWQSARDLAFELRWIADSDSGVGVRAPSTSRLSGRTLLLGGVAAAAIGAGLLAGGKAIVWPRPAAAVYTPVTLRQGAVSAARFTPDAQNIIYSASWEGRPYDVFLGHESSADARALGLETGRILSISPTGDMAVLFGPQNMTHVFGSRILARVALAGGARRDLLEGVVDADWIPGTDTLAVVRVRETDGMSDVEFPLGKKVYSARAVWSLRVSHDGRRIAFFEGPGVFETQPEAMITVIDGTGGKSTVTRGWAGVGLAWASDFEIWFTATRGDHAPQLEAVSLSGRQRQVQTVPDWVVLQDISRDGRVLLARNSVRSAIACRAPNESTERDLTWMGGSVAKDLSPDGSRLIFSEILYGATAGVPWVFRRSLDGSPAVRLGRGTASSVSPDGRWVLVEMSGEWVLLPAGAGTAKTLAKGTLSKVWAGTWLPDGERIAFTGVERGSAEPRVYVQNVRSGAPRSITSEGVWAPVRAVSPDGTWILARAGTAWLLYPTDRGEPRPLPGLTLHDEVLGWSLDGRSIFVRDGSWSGPSLDVFQVELKTGRRTLWRTLAPADPVGVDNIWPVVITPDAHAYCYSYLRRLGTLFVVDGLK